MGNITKRDSKIFNEKVNLIYEYNKKSPLFARMAHLEIEKNNIDRGIEILRRGLTEFSKNPVANLLLGKAYMLRGNYAEAKKYFKTGSELIRSPETYKFYLNELESIRKERAVFEESKKKEFIPHSKAEPNTDKSGNSNNGTLSSVEERLEQLAKDISNVKIKPGGGNNVSEISLRELYDNNLILSDTLAKIYIAQGQPGEALKVYEKLLKQNPGKKDYYLQKIKELKSEKS